jgi:UDP-N-acetylglucosamine 1-carboxyvinyltransferase
MSQIGLCFSDIENGLRVESSGEIAATNISTAPHPGFPTDLQAQAMALLCFANGESVISENIWENRFMHTAELMRMGACISVCGSEARIKGVKTLNGAQVMATDLRASSSLILAALAANGNTVVDRIYHLDRGYCCVKEKLADCGVIIERTV